MYRVLGTIIYIIEYIVEFTGVSIKMVSAR